MIERKLESRPWVPSDPGLPLLESAAPIPSGKFHTIFEWWVYRHGYAAETKETYVGRGEWWPWVDLISDVPTVGDSFIDWVVNQTPRRTWTVSDHAALRRYALSKKLVERTRADEIAYRLGHLVDKSNPAARFGIAKSTVRLDRLPSTFGPELFGVPRFFRGDELEAAYDFYLTMEHIYAFMGKEGRWRRLGVDPDELQRHLR